MGPEGSAVIRLHPSTGGRHLDTPWSHHPGISARPWVDDPTLARGWIETGSPPLGPAFARAPKIPPARPLGREPNEFSQPHAPRVVFSDSSTTLRGKSSSHSPRWPPESPPGVLGPSHHIQTLKKLGLTKPPTSPSSSTRTRRASRASSTNRSGRASQRAHDQGRPLAYRGERSATPAVGRTRP